MTVDEAIRHLYTYSSTNGSGQTTDAQHEEAKQMGIKALKAQQWIPCTSTKRPKDREEVMVTIDDGYQRYTDTDEFVNGQYWYHDDKQVVAWKPFDEPWKGEDNGQSD